MGESLCRKSSGTSGKPKKGVQFSVYYSLVFLIIFSLIKDAVDVHFTRLHLNKNVWAWTLSKACFAQTFGSFKKTWALNPSNSSVHTTQHLAHRMGQDYCINEDQSKAHIPIRSGQILNLLVNCWRTHFSAWSLELKNLDSCPDNYMAMSKNYF